MFHPKAPEAILKNEVAVCWGRAMERMPTGEFGALR